MAQQKQPTDLTINSLRGGMNNQDSPHILPDDQCVLAENVEFFLSTLGERRKGMETVDITASTFDTKTVMVHMGVHIPRGNTLEETELIAVAATPSTTAQFARRNSSYVWTPITPIDTPNVTEPIIYQMQSISIHGKWYVMYKSSEDRAHVWDGTSLRRAGIIAPTLAPIVADTAVAGAFVDDRTYRVRFVEMSGSTVVRRSEPSPEVTFTPAGTFDGTTITQPAVVNEGETHWEVEASNGDGNFYVIATEDIATTTVTDTTQPSTDYADFVLSEDVGEYDLIPSAKYVIADQDRVIFGGSWEDAEKGSRIQWTPVWAAPGVGNDERIPSDTDNFVDLDWQDGGELTGLSAPINGAFYAFKLNRIYKVQRTGILNNAYEAFLLSQFRGAIHGSVINGVDEFGRGCVYFLDPAVGPMRVGNSGVQQMQNIRGTWLRANTSATQIICHGIYFPDKQQVWWWLAIDSEDSPNYMIRNQVTEIRTDDTGGGGTDRGWTVATGHLTDAWCSVVVPEVVEDSDTGATLLSFRPYAGFEGPDYIQRCDVGSKDNRDTYRAIIRTKPYIVAGLLNWWGAMAGALLAQPINDPTVKLQVKFIRDFGLEEDKVTTDFVPEKSEDLVIKLFDNLKMSHAHAIQVEFSDPE
jgi:hypothetical protein